MDTVPSPHSGLGLDAYIQATSPIRRYLDLVLQRQIGGFLGGIGPVYAKEGLEEIRVEVEPVTRELERIKRNRLRYWILKFLSQNVGKRYRAIVLDEMKTKYRIVLMDFLLTAEVRRRNGLILSPGQEVVVEVKKSDPFDDVLRLDLAEGGP
jgi:exoribonuclease-2